MEIQISNEPYYDGSDRIPQNAACEIVMIKADTKIIIKDFKIFISREQADVLQATLIKGPSPTSNSDYRSWTAEYESAEGRAARIAGENTIVALADGTNLTQQSIDGLKSSFMFVVKPKPTPKGGRRRTRTNSRRNKSHKNKRICRKSVKRLHRRK
jgi:hypothetical protein